MECVIVERTFDKAVTFAELEEVERKSGWCLDVRNIKFLRSYVSGDGKRMMCVYNAPDAEAVRQAQRQIGLPFDRVWTASVYE